MTGPPDSPIVLVLSAVAATVVLGAIAHALSLRRCTLFIEQGRALPSTPDDYS